MKEDSPAYPMTARVTDAMIAYYSGDMRRITHFLAVYGFAKAIGEYEQLDAPTQEILEIAALTHDIGIRPSLEKFGKSSAATQQTEGPPAARAMLAALGCPENVIDRVCWLISRHHTYGNIEGRDYQILVEADFLVNITGRAMEEGTIRKLKKNIFRTEAGLRFLAAIYGV
ncbi:conserved hypothetical protein [uncultured delta proteobacterium]|uniref:HD domain-containing protein n=1 Tax=uncultured delta proteobacterium TaxID=34034 RepID=A0A212KFA2_9DELT|nr:conserved hypothetical protein [uncultured delta proteobacterium]